MGMCVCVCFGASIVDQWDSVPQLDLEKRERVMHREFLKKVKRRDWWDEEYDRGKVKKVKQKKPKFASQGNGSNPFQAQAERKKPREINEVAFDNA